MWKVEVYYSHTDNQRVYYKSEDGKLSMSVAADEITMPIPRVMNVAVNWEYQW